jgi:hypothetical protein
VKITSRLRRIQPSACTSPALTRQILAKFATGVFHDNLLFFPPEYPNLVEFGAKMSGHFTCRTENFYISNNNTNTHNNIKSVYCYIPMTTLAICLPLTATYVGHIFFSFHDSSFNDKNKALWVKVLENFRLFTMP